MPGAGLADAQRAVPQQQDGKGQHTADSGSKGGAQCCARYPPAKAPDGHCAAKHHHLTGGIDEAEVKDHIQHAGQHADKARCQGIAGGTQHGGVGSHDHQKGQGSRPDGKVGRSIRLQGRISTQPSGQKAADANAEGRSCKAHHKVEDHRLAQHTACIVLPVCTQILCHLNGKGHI